MQIIKIKYTSLLRFVLGKYETLIINLSTKQCEYYEQFLYNAKFFQIINITQINVE